MFASGKWSLLSRLARRKEGTGHIKDFTSKRKDERRVKLFAGTVVGFFT